MKIFLKFFAPLIFGLIILFIFFRETVFFAKTKTVCKNFFNFCLTNLVIKKITKYSIIFFTLVKLALSLYVISLIFTPNPFYAFVLMIILLFSSSLILYKIWVLSKLKQKIILFLVGGIVFSFITIFIFGIFLSLPINLFFLFDPKYLPEILKEFILNFKFNLVFSFISVILFHFFSLLLLRSLKKIKIENAILFKKFLEFFDFLGSFPRIFYGLNCFFLNQVINPNQNFFILASICAFHSSIFYIIQKIRMKFFEDDFSFDFYITSDLLNFKKQDNLLKKNKIFQNLSYFWVFLNEITILVPVFLLSKNIKFGEFYSSFLRKLFEIFQTDSLFEIDFILISGLIFLIFHFSYIFFRKKLVKFN